MYVKNFVICDKEQQYARNLLQMFQRKKAAGIEMFLFHDVEEAERFSEQKPIHILLIDEAYPQEERERISAKRTYVLVKNMPETSAEQEHLAGMAALPDGERQPGRKMAGRTVYRYQSASQIWKQIFEPTKRVAGQKGKGSDKIRGERKKRNPRQMAKAKGELIAVYSPIHRIGKTLFALELGRKLAQKKPVLYLSLEEYAGDAFYFSDKPEQNLADLLYYFRQGRENFAVCMSMMAGQDGKLDYILPMPYVQDMQAVKREEWIELFAKVLEECIYEKVVLDLGDSIDGLLDILGQCATVYTPYIEEPAAKAKLNQYFENLRKMGREDILEKTVQKKMQG